MPPEMVDYGLAVAGGILRMEVLEPHGVRQGSRREAPELSRAVRQVKRAGRNVPVIDSLRCGASRDLVALLAVPERFFCLLQLVDLARCSDQAYRVALAIAQCDAVLSRPQPRAVSRAKPIVALESLGFPLQVRDDRGVEARQVLAVDPLAPTGDGSVVPRGEPEQLIDALGVVDLACRDVPVVNP